MKIGAVREALQVLPERTENICAVIVGGTSGIGEATVLALASRLGTGSQVWIVGRNQQAAERIIDECRTRSEARHVSVGVEFLKQDVALLKDVDLVCDKIKGKLGDGGKIDLLFMSQGYLSSRGRKDTAEGLDHVMSLRYYSRMRFIHSLLPALLAAPSPRVISVYAPGKPELFSLNVDDLGLVEPGNYGVAKSLAHASYMNTLCMSALAARYSHVSFLHVYPGLIITPEWNAADFPGWLKWLALHILVPIVSYWTMDYAEVGDRMVYNAFAARYPAAEGINEEAILPFSDGAEALQDSQGKKGGGAYTVDSDNEAVVHRKNMQLARAAGAQSKVWEHTMQVFESVKSL